MPKIYIWFIQKVRGKFPARIDPRLLWPVMPPKRKVPPTSDSNQQVAAVSAVEDVKPVDVVKSDIVAITTQKSTPSTQEPPGNRIRVFFDLVTELIGLFLFMYFSRCESQSVYELL